MEDNQNPPQNTSTSDESSTSGEDRSSRAKAFYRAMFAGGEPDPEAFGIDIGNKAKESDSHTQAAVAHLETSLKEMEQKFTDADNGYKRLAADFENYRKRMDREREEFQALGMQKALEAILPALDDFDMAQSKLTENTETKVMFDSVKMIYSRFMRCLEQLGIKQMEVKPGDLFDPNFHYGVASVPSREFPEGAVASMLRPGYVMKEKVLRPSLVNVASYMEEEVVSPSAPSLEEQALFNQGEECSAVDVGAQTCDTLESIGMERCTQDLPIEEIKKALAMGEAVNATGVNLEQGGVASGKVYDLSDVDLQED